MLDSDVSDRTTKREWSIDLREAGKARAFSKLPTKHRRQRITTFLEREGDIEHFAIRQTLPYRGYEGEAYPSQAQYGAVADFYLQCCETRFQAHTMLCARDYARVIASQWKFTAPRRELIWLSVAAYILSDRDLRARIRSWNARANMHIETGIANHPPFKKMHKFVGKLVADLQSQGSTIFGEITERA